MRASSATSAAARPACAQLGVLAAQRVELVGDRPLREVLEPGIERGLDQEAAPLLDARRLLVRDQLGDPRHELARRRGARRRQLGANRLSLGSLDVGPFAHSSSAIRSSTQSRRSRSAAACSSGDRRFGAWIIAASAAASSSVSDARRLREVDARGGADAVHGEAAHVAEVDGVQVGLEDLVLAVLGLERERSHRLVGLASERPLRCEVAVLDQLLRDGRPALRQRTLADVVDRRARDADGVDAGMVEEARVLGGEDRAPDVLGQVLDADQHAVGALAAQRLGEQLRLDPGVGRRLRIGRVVPSASRRPRTLPVRGVELEAEQLGGAVLPARVRRSPVDPDHLVADRRTRPPGPAARARGDSPAVRVARPARGPVPRRRPRSRTAASRSAFRCARARARARRRSRRRQQRPRAGRPSCWAIGSCALVNVARSRGILAP